MSAPVQLIREVLEYSERFRGSRFVIQIASPVIDHPSLGALVADLVRLQKAGISMLLVPGAGTRIDEVLRRYQLDFQVHRGVRISSSEAIPFIKMAAFDVANRLMTLLSRHRSNAVIGNWVRAKAIGVRNGVDFQETGTVAGIDREMVESTLREGLIPIFPCIGWSATGRPYNLSSRELAAALAVSLEAEKLFFVSDSSGITGSGFVVPDAVSTTTDGRISRMDVDDAARFLQSNAERADEDAVEIVRLARDAAQHGVDRVHILDGTQDGAIPLEVFSLAGGGTMVHARAWESLRPAANSDVPALLELMQPLVDDGFLVPRSGEELQALIDDFAVYETDGRIIGCGAVHRLDAVVGELAGLVVDNRYGGTGVGARLVAYLIERAAQKGFTRLVALTTRTADWFERQGFVAGGVADLPESRRARYDGKRRSRILVRSLSS